MKTYNKNIQLNEDNLETRIDKCPFCSSGKIKEIGIIQKKPLINAKKCTVCHLGYADRQPTQEVLNKYYNNYYDINRNTTIKKELLINHLKKYITNVIINKEYNILDFGGGDGSISYGLAQEILKTNKTGKINIYVIDPNFIKLKEIHKLITIHNFPSIEFIPTTQKFDFVIASAVLEHVKNPRKILMQLLRIMNTNGKFYIRTPYMYPFKYLFSKIGINLNIFYPGHLFDMGSKFWNTILKTTNQENNYQILTSQTSLVESTFNNYFFRTLAAYILKFPSKLLKKHYHFVGGWEVLIEKKYY